jgi:DNA helicase MCM8
VTVDWQGLKLQEMVDHDDGGGRVPRTVECEVTEDLCDTAHPGDVVTISGNA